MTALAAFFRSAGHGILALLNRLPLWMQQQHLKKLREAAEEDPKNADKHASLLSELNKVNPREVITRVESKQTHSTWSVAVVPCVSAFTHQCTNARVLAHAHINAQTHVCSHMHTCTLYLIACMWAWCAQDVFGKLCRKRWTSPLGTKPSWLMVVDTQLPQAFSVAHGHSYSAVLQLSDAT
eukprot:scaffold87522_cov20-Tisochrysis_lutea.AAC.1